MSKLSLGLIIAGATPLPTIFFIEFILGKEAIATLSGLALLGLIILFNKEAGKS